MTFNQAWAAHLALWLVAIVVWGIPPTAEALPLYTTANCSSAGPTAGSGWNTDPGGKVRLYVESDFAAELNSCLAKLAVSSPTEGISEFHVRQVVRAAADTWTRAARGSYFTYQGTVNADDGAAACSQMGSSSTPRIFINYREGCFVSGGACSQSAWGVATTITGCANAYMVTIYGDGTGWMSNEDCGGSSIRDYRVDGQDGHQNGVRDLQGLLLHEIGHSLDFGDDPGFASIMSRSTGVLNASTGRVWRRHLYPRDLDCVDDSYGHRGLRSLRYRWRGLKSDGTWWSSGTGSGETAKAAISGGFLRSTSVNKYYGLYEDDLLRRTWVGTNGTLVFNYSNSLSNGYKVQDLYYSPVQFSPEEKSGTDQAHRLHFAQRWTAPPPTTANIGTIDPPRWFYLRSDDFFASGVSTNYRECSNAGCSSQTDIRSHVSLVAAYDEVSDTSVFASVDTSRYLDQTDVSLTSHGQIKVYPGFNSGNHLLRTADTLSNAGGVPADPYDGLGGNPNWNYTQRTDVAPALACAPPEAGWTYNCLLAWVDRGTPDFKVLYTYFRINPTTKDIEWKSLAVPPYFQDVWAIADAMTYSHISAAFFNGRFHLAWKSTYPGADVEYTSTSTMTGWDPMIYISNSGGVVDPPTWGYVPTQQDREIGLIWTEEKP